MYSRLESNKESHCRNNTIKLKMCLSCEKCKQQDKRLTKQFDNCKSYYQHLLFFHSGTDKLERPTRDDCISNLQVISNAIVKGVLR